MDTRGIPDAGLILGLKLHVSLSAIYFQDCLHHSFTRYDIRPVCPWANDTQIFLHSMSMPAVVRHHLWWRLPVDPTFC